MAKFLKRKMCGGVNLAMDFLFDEWAMLVQLDSRSHCLTFIAILSVIYWGIDSDLKMICFQNPQWGATLLMPPKKYPQNLWVVVQF